MTALIHLIIANIDAWLTAFLHALTGLL